MTRQTRQVPQADEADTKRRSEISTPSPSPPAVNEVHLRGRISGEPQARELPSGDVVVQLRVVVKRPEPKSRPPKPKVSSSAKAAPAAAKVAPAARVSIDTIDVACWTAVLRRAASRCQDGDVVTVRGSLRRRFWRSGAGAASRYEVEVSELTRDRRSADATPARR